MKSFADKIRFHEMEGDVYGTLDVRAYLELGAHMYLSQTVLKSAAQTPVMNRVRRELIEKIHYQLYGALIQELKEIRALSFAVRDDDSHLLVIDRIGSLIDKLKGLT